MQTEGRVTRSRARVCAADDTSERRRAGVACGDSFHAVRLLTVPSPPLSGRLIGPPSPRPAAAMVAEAAATTGKGRATKGRTALKNDVPERRDLFAAKAGKASARPRGRGGGGGAPVAIGLDA